ncbi:MAG: hypothetical protein HY885_06535 [Deltaproteobacteria bacterium]|nr:hypothetical protein [Deltaproteobacteria bacterium]
MNLKTFFCLSAAFIALPCFSASPVTAETYTAHHIPWSGYWWPYSSGGLVTGAGYYGSPAPIEKYELLEESSYPGELSRYYRDYYYDPAAPDWYGHCNSWALAAISEHLDIMPSSEENIVFRVGDKKGLLTLAHEKDLVELGDGASAAVFHYWLLYYLKDRQQGFVADLDPGEERWNYPIYQVAIQSNRVGGTEEISATIYYATDNVHPDFIGAKKIQKTYTYTLQLDSQDNIISGAWTNDSIIDHPDRLMFPKAFLSVSPLLDYQEVLRIAQSRDDHLENGDQLVSLPPGKYNLTLLDVDRYQLVCNAGDTVELAVEKVVGSPLAMTAVLIDGSGAVVDNVEFAGEGSVVWQFAAANPPYELELSQADYSAPNIYSLAVDLDKTANYHFPFLPKNGMWSGFALTNPSDSPVEQVMLTTNDESGRPLHTLLGPETLNGGEKKVFLFSALPWRQHELAQTSSLTLRADGEVEVLNLFGSTTQLASQVQKINGSSQLIFPETIPELDPRRSLAATIINESFTGAQVDIAVFSASGILLSQRSVNLEGREQLNIKPGVAPFYSLPDGGWLKATTPSGNILCGFYYLNGPDQAEGMFTLPADSETKVIPHIPPPGNWFTTVTLINPNGSANRIVLHPVKGGGDQTHDLVVNLKPFEKKNIELQDLFGFAPGNPLYHSIVEIYAEKDFAGFYTYQSASKTDKAKYPLISTAMLDSELVMPHNPGANGYWWTGVGVFNPMGSIRNIEVLPYGKQGQLLAAQKKNFQLAGGEYKVFTLNGLFGDIAADISFIKCRPLGDNDTIGGFYLYGGNGEKMLGGAVM